MKPVDEPARLLDGPDGGDHELSAALGRLQAKAPTPEQLTALSRSLGIVVAPLSAARVHGELSAARAASPLLKVLAIVGVVGGAAWGLFAFHRSSAPESGTLVSDAPVNELVQKSKASRRQSAGAPTPRGTTARDAVIEHAGGGPDAPPRVAESAPAQTKPVAPSFKAVVSDATAEPSLRRTSPYATAKSSHRKSEDAQVASSARASVDSAGSRSETALLNDARGILGRDPSAALALTERHRRDYPAGVFVQEREVIAVTALTRLGRTDQARARAAAFRRAYPRSPYQAQVDRLVGTAPGL